MGSDNGGLHTAPEITEEEREEIAARNRALLDRDLLEKRVVFESRPYEAHVQFSNFCNMSCIMCWDGNNPPLKKMSPVVLERLRTEIAPNLCVVSPHDGSEPTTVTWDETVALARDYNVQLALTTNGQLFDEEKFHEVKDHLEMVLFSIDSHIPEIFEQIRPGADAARVYDNLETAARLCETHGVELWVQIVFMTLNAPHMPDLIAAMADRGARVMNVIQMIDVNRHSWHLDATMHFSAEYLDWVKGQCVAVAKERKLKLGWYLADHQFFDFTDPERAVPERESKRVNDRRDTDMRYRHPGFCKYAYDRVRLRADGYISPCGLDCDGELEWGNLGEQHFDELWNGPAAQDLRRGHYTWDYTSICKSCRYVDLLPAPRTRPVMRRYLAGLGHEEPDLEPSLPIRGPEHMLRTESAPEFVVDAPRGADSSYDLVTSLGGFEEGMVVVELQAAERRDGALGLTMGEVAWNALETNMGYWWAVVERAGDVPVARTPEMRCLIRHQPLPRIEGSNLNYPDEEHFAPVYLGGDRKLGWDARGDLPHRPPLRKSAAVLEPGKRFDRLRTMTAAPSAPARMSPDAYREMVGHVRDVVASALPEGAVALVATKGDAELLVDERRTLSHFPADAEGEYAGFHPPDDEWAIDHLEQARRAGAEFLVIPASMRWWLDHYRGLAEHLQGLREAIVDDRQRCTIFHLRPPAPEHHVKPSTAELAALADRTLGYGGHHRMAFRRFHRGDDVFPRFATDAAGYDLIDSDGRRFIDWVNGGGPVILGYRHPAVSDAIAAQLPVGPTLTLTHPVEVQVAQMLTEMVPCAEMVAFGKNGSDAVTAAVRLARAVTGREMILQYGAHGFHDWIVALHGVPGVPKVLGSLVRSFPYNDLAALEALFEEHPGEVAAVVMEPVNIELPHEGYLQGVLELTRRHGALLVFDEVITAFRLGTGGAQQRFGVVPDLACLGKAMANGMPLSAVVGKRAYMERLPDVAYGMTYRGETLSLAAAAAVLGILREQRVAEHLEYIGELVRGAFERACADVGVQASLLGPGARMTFMFDDEATVQREAAFVLECARHGVLTNGNILPSLPHDERAVQRTEEAFHAALSHVKALSVSGREAVSRAMQMAFERCGTSPAGGPEGLPAASLDVAREEGQWLVLRGWLLAGDGGRCDIEVTAPSGAVRPARPVDRPDVAAAFPAAPGALHSGFYVALPVDEFVAGDRFDFRIRARRGGDTLFDCRVTKELADAAPEISAPRLADDGVLHL